MYMSLWILIWLQILCRTAIALEQEKVIERNNKEIDDLKSEINVTKQNIASLKAEFEKLTKHMEANEIALKDKEEMIKNNNLGMCVISD